MPDSQLFSLQQLVVDLCLIERKHYLPKTERHENDIEHSMSVALLCWYVYVKNKLDLDLVKIFQYALVHDFVERYAGDVSTFASDIERENKVNKEKESLKRLSSEFGSFSEMIESMQAYELKEDEEARFVWTVDKMQQLILGDMDNWRPWRPGSDLLLTYGESCMKYDGLLEKASPYAQEIFKELICYSKKTFGSGL